ncbi:MAG: T9SS type A sorting domain-containing protein [Crocinitomicaceae bacterium]|nr:T9SS type A sorting domain-containing protein [Crocinitomicaceae bacterium]
MKSFILSILLILAGSTMAQTISTFPYNEDFEGEGSSTACSGYVMASPGWLNDTGDDNDWVPDAGGTISFGTGPSVDFNPGTFSGKYMYTETSGCNSDTRNLESPWFEFLATSGMEFSFAYHMFGGDMGTLTVEYRTGLVAPWTTLTGPITDNIDSWQTSSTDITFLSGEDSVQFRFVANTGIGFTSDMAIDDVSLTELSMTATVINILDETCLNAANGSMTMDVDYGISPVTYLWDTGDPSDTLATLSDIGPGTYCCTATDGDGSVITLCADIVALATDSLQVFAHATEDWICTDSMGLLIIDSIVGGAPSPVLCGLSSYSCESAQDTLQIGTEDFTIGGTTYPSPLGNWYWGTRHQMLITASELTAAGIVPGNLSGMAFNIDVLGTADPNLTSFTIKLGSTSEVDMLFGWDEAGPVEVLAPGDVTISPGWNWYDFDIPYYWNGTDNIIVETCFNNTGFTNNPQMWVSTTSYTSVRYYRADNPSVCGSSLTTGTSANRPVMQFKNCSATPGYPYIFSWDTGSADDTTMVLGGTYTLTVEDGTGCVETLDVTINESGPVNIDDVTICETNPTDFIASSSFDSYTWSTGETTQTISITTGGTYYVDAVDSLGCPTSDTAFVSTLPPPVISASSNDVIFGSDGYIDLLVYGSAFPFMIDWDNDGTGDNDDAEDQFGLDAGDYTVIVTDTNGCYATLTITVDSQLGLYDQTESIFEIYPNPTQGIIYVKPIYASGEEVYGEILDITGRLVSGFTISGDNTTVVDLSNEESGVYFVRITADGKQRTAKLIVE